jgi:hypothetical protein
MGRREGRDVTESMDVVTESILGITQIFGGLRRLGNDLQI